MSPGLDLGEPTTHWKCTCRQHLYLCHYPLCGSIASPSSSGFQSLELSHHLVQHFLPTPKAVPSTTHIYHLEMPTISTDIYFERSDRRSCHSLEMAELIVLDIVLSMGRTLLLRYILQQGARLQIGTGESVSILIVLHMWCVCVCV